jgi:hypothetical protein
MKTLLVVALALSALALGALSLSGCCRLRCPRASATCPASRQAATTTPATSATDPSGTPASCVGTYTLVAIDGNPLPYAPLHEGRRLIIVQSGTSTLKPDGTFTSTMSYTNPTGAAFSRDFSGTYTLEDNRIAYTWHGAGRTTATIDGNTITMDNEGVLYTSRR